MCVHGSALETVSIPFTTFMATRFVCLKRNVAVQCLLLFHFYIERSAAMWANRTEPNCQCVQSLLFCYFFLYSDSRNCIVQLIYVYAFCLQHRNMLRIRKYFVILRNTHIRLLIYNLIKSSQSIWDATLHSPVELHQDFGVKFYLHLQGPQLR